jgi:CheY-like chemotaxis protein
MGQSKSQNSEKPTALIVDDDQINRLILEKMLGSLGFSTVSVCSGRDAVSVVKEQGFDLIFLDIQMPKMDGYQTAMVIRSIENGSPTPIIAVTANALNEDRIKARDAGMDSFLTKPVNLEAIHKLVERFSQGADSSQKPKRASNSGSHSFINKLDVDLEFAKDMIERMETNALEIIQEMRQDAKSNRIDRIPGLRHKLKGLLSAVNDHQTLMSLEKLPQFDQNCVLAGYIQRLDRLEDEIIQYAKHVRNVIKDQSA